MFAFRVDGTVRRAEGGKIGNDEGRGRGRLRKGCSEELILSAVGFVHPEG